MSELHIGSIVLAALATILLAVRWCVRLARELQAERARESFRLQRERLQDIFLKAAASTGKPRGLHWISCNFMAEITLLRDRRTRRLVGFVPATITFEPVAGSDMEGLPAAKEPRFATAVLHFRHGQWGSDGRTIFNVSPQDAVPLFAREYQKLTADR